MYSMQDALKELGVYEDGTIHPGGPFSAKVNDGDFTDEADGLLHCGKCGEAKQLKLPIPETLWDKLGESRIVFRACACRRAEAAIEEEVKREAERIDNIKKLRRRGIEDERYLKCTFESDDRREAKIRETCLNYVKKWEEVKEKNIGLAFVGDVGTGKTFYAASIANAIIDKGVAAIITTIPALHTSMSANYGENRDFILNQIRSIPLLVLDDVGVERATPAAMENTYTIINERYKAKRPLIITTNISKAEILNPTTEHEKRIYDRICEMCPAIIQPKIKRRRAISEDKRREALSILTGGDDRQ